MACILSTKRKLMSILFIIFFFTFVKSEPEKKTLEEKITELENEGNKDYNFIQNFKLDLPYLKIEMKTIDPQVDFIFSFYKGNDSNFNNRIQLSKSISGKAFMYLKKEELDAEFYIKIEFKKKTSKYNLILTQKENIEISIGEQYSYYVTNNDNKMEFILVGTPKIEYNYTNNLIFDRNNKLSVWAKGSQDLTMNLKVLSVNSNTLTKKSFSSYIIELINEDEINYHFTIEGNEGDLIKIGSSLFNTENLCQTIITDSNMEIFGFLKKEVMDKIYFLTSQNLKFIFEKITDNEHSILQNSPKQLNDKQNIPQNLNIYSFESNVSEQFYSFEFKINERDDEGYPPVDTHLMLLGTNYYLYLEKGESIGLLPMKTITDNKYLTLYSNSESGKYNSFILNCDNYPFCVDDKSKKEQLKEYNSVCISYDNKQYGQNSVIQKNQKILILNCESEKCNIYVDMYTEKNQAIIKPSLVYYKYIRENNEDNLIIDVSQEIKNYYIHIEILSGISNAEIIYFDSNDKKFYQDSQDNMLIYELKSENQKDQNLIPIKIKAKKNLAYSIIVTSENEDYKPQVNYLNIYKEENPINLCPLLDDSNNYLYYIGISPFNFDINNIEITSTSNEKKNMLQKDKYYQEFINYKNEVFKFNNTNSNEKNDILLYRMSIFKYMSDFNSNDNSIVLSYNSEYPFIYTPTFNKMKYMYLHTNNGKGLCITIELIDKVKYNLELYFNEVKQKEYNFEKNYNISISPEKIDELKIDNTQPIKISFIISSEEKENNKILKLKINEYTDDNGSDNSSDNNSDTTIDSTEDTSSPNPPDDDDDDDDKKKLVLYIGIPTICVFVIIIIIVIICLLKNKAAYDKLNKQINSISFKRDEGIGRDSKDDDLLE